MTSGEKQKTRRPSGPPFFEGAEKKKHPERTQSSGNPFGSTG
jgi:hypothetical protein